MKRAATRAQPRGEHGLRRAVVSVGQRLLAAGLIAATDGNISVRLDSRHLLITPAGVPKGELRPPDLVVVDDSGTVFGPGVPTSEIGLHLETYRSRPDVQAAVHAHPPWAIAASMQPEVAFDLTPEAIVLLGGVARLPYVRPGTPAVGKALREVITQANAFLLVRHGSLCLGSTLEQALMRTQALEHNAKIGLLARLGGAPISGLPPAEVAALAAAGRPAAAPGGPSKPHPVRGFAARMISAEESLVLDLKRWTHETR